MWRNRVACICIVASSGGHLMQLLQIAEAWSKYPAFYVTTSEVAMNSLRQRGRTYVIKEAARQHFLRTLICIIQCVYILPREKPRVIISTGSGSGCIMCLIGKIFGAKIVWIDSVANIRRLSFSGRIIRYFADLCFTQWPNVAAKYKKVKYVGRII